MTSMQQWTTGQWAVFTITIILGIAAFVLAYAARSAVLGWTAPAPLRVAAQRPTVMRAEHRQLAARHAPAMAIEAGWIDPMKVDFADDGIGALSSIQQAEVDPIMETAAERDAWVNAYADLKPMMTETAAAREAMRIALEPAERKARLWLMRTGEVGARAVLAGWRMDTPTAELAPLDRQYMMARALLVS